MTKARWAREIWTALHPENSSGNSVPTGIGYGKPPLRPTEFAADTAAVGDTEKIIKSGARTARKAVQRRKRRRA
jgi:hypothetical protein